MPNPVRYTSGVSTANKGSTLFNLPVQDPTKIYTFFDDFGSFVSAQYTETKIGTGTTAIVASEPFGAIASTASAADNDGHNFQVATASFVPNAGKQWWFKARMKISDATQSDWILGLAVLDTTLLGAVDGAGTTDGIFFSKDDGDTQIDVQVQKDATTGQLRRANVATNDTSYHTYGFYYNPTTQNVEYYIDDIKVYTLNATSAYFPDAAALTPSWAFLNGEAVAKIMTLDYIFAATER